MIKAVVFDLNGVFIHCPKLSTRLHEKYGIDEASFIPQFHEAMEKVRRKNAGDAFKHFRPLLEKFGIRTTKKEFFDFWFEAEKEDPVMIELAKQIKRNGVKVIIFSNGFKERTEYYRKTFSFMKDVLDKIYFSWETGFVKPDPEAFKNLLKDSGLRAEDCLYFDDKPANVDAASRIGIKAFLFSGMEDLKRILKENKVI